MPPRSVAAIFAYPEKTFSNDVKYSYHPNPDLYYLTGYREPDAVLLLFKEPIQTDGKSINELFFVRERDTLAEKWTGKRLGVEGVKSQLGIANVYAGGSFKSSDIDFSTCDTFLYDYFPAEVANDGSHESVYGLLSAFHQKTKQPKVQETQILSLFNWLSYNPRNMTLDRLAQIVVRYISQNTLVAENETALQFASKPDSVNYKKIQRYVAESGNANAERYIEILNTLREIKTPEELQVLRRSIDISCIAHAEMMKTITPSSTEWGIEGVFRYVHLQYGSEDEGYPPIVAGGGNACVLHYIDKEHLPFKNQLVLMDVGSEYHGYSADVTRTVPANGKFTPEQKAIYGLVLDAQEAVMKLCKAGTPFPELNKKATEVIAIGLVKLGIISKPEEVTKYYYHGVSHHLGLDVHDRSNYGDLRENMVITVEPGIYIAKGSSCAQKWWNIGVRIEDDVFIGKERCELLSVAAPRKVEEIEALMAKKSKLKEYKLPTLGKGQ